MDFRGTFDHGVIRPSGDENFPDGAEVEFRLVPPKGGIRQPLTPEEIVRLDRLARTPKTLEQLIAEQGTRPIKSIKDLRVPGIQDEDIDDLLKSLREGS